MLSVYCFIGSNGCGLCVFICVFVFTSQDVPAYPGGHEHISTADAVLSPLAEGFATCIENEWSLHTRTRILAIIAQWWSACSYHLHTFIVHNQGGFAD